MRPKKLDEFALQEAVAKLLEWRLMDGELVRELTFPSFPQAIAFVNQAAELAEKADYHPDIDIRYNRVKLVLVTHDAAGITGNDIEMAKSLNAISNI